LRDPTILVIPANAGIQYAATFRFNRRLWDRRKDADQPNGLREALSALRGSYETTLPIPFALDIDQPQDCPGELELIVSTRDTEQPAFRRGDEPLTGWNRIDLDRFESLPVWGPFF
jgi:hypothetical protein